MELSAQVICDVYCHHVSDDTRYRLYVNDELFTERTWIWHEHYLEESIVVVGQPGRYRIRYELVSPTVSELEIRDPRLGQFTGQAVLHQDRTLELAQ